MLKTVYRISVMYFVSIVLMRLAGKREIAQMEVNELVTSFLVSEIACMPITDPEVPLVDSIVFAATVIVFEMIFTLASMRIPFVKHLTTGKPDFLVVNGRLDPKVLGRAKVSLSELVSAMRANGVTSLADVNYAVQEPDGNISIIPYGETSDEKSGLQHMLVCDGRLNKTEMERFGYSERDVENILDGQGIDSVKKVFFLGVDDEGNVFVIEK